MRAYIRCWHDAARCFAGLGVFIRERVSLTGRFLLEAIL